MRENLIKAVENEKIIAIVRGVERKELISLAEAMYDGGIRLIELTYDLTGKTPDVETADRIAMLAEHFDGRMNIGAGTVVKEEQVALTASAGGGFIISPDTYRPVIEKTRALSLVSIPGALTPTEVQTAHRYGADFVKLFPVCSLGTEYVKAIKAPLSHIRLLGVGEEIQLFAFIAFSCPLGLNTIIYPAAYGGETRTGASMAMISHVLSVITIPLMYLLLFVVL